MIIKVKITEVVQVLRTRLVDLEVETPFKERKYNLDEGKGDELQQITNLVREQHSKTGDITEQVIKAEIL